MKFFLQKMLMILFSCMTINSFYAHDNTIEQDVKNAHTRSSRSNIIKKYVKELEKEKQEKRQKAYHAYDDRRFQNKILPQRSGAAVIEKSGMKNNKKKNDNDDDIPEDEYPFQLWFAYLDKQKRKPVSRKLLHN